MIIRTWKNIDVEVESEVTLDDVLNEFAERISVGGEPCVDRGDRRFKEAISPIDFSTRLLNEIPDEIVSLIPDDVLLEITNRLKALLKKYEIKKENNNGN